MRERSLVPIVWAMAILPVIAPHARGGGTPERLTRPRPPSVSSARALLDQYCVTCHNERQPTAGLTLDTLDVGHVADDAETWETVVRKLRARAMPPARMPRPDAAVYDGFRGWLESELDRAAAANPDPGRTPTFHRLNRAEYGNAVRDLLALELDVERLLPSDPESYGFDNIGDVLSLSPVLLERYLTAARRISRLAVGDLGLSPTTEHYRIRSDLAQDDRIDGLPWGTRGGTVITHYFPLDGVYDVRITLARDSINDTIVGLREPHQIEVTVDGRRVQLFTVGEVPAGDDERRARRRLSRTADAALRVRVPVRAGRRVVGVTFIARPAAEVERVRQPFLRAAPENGDTHGQPYLSAVTISGPYDPTGPGDTPSRQRLFVCRPVAPDDEARCARTVLSTVARRAYRRPLNAAEIRGLLTFYDDGRRKGGFDRGIELALTRILVSPSFLFRVERDPPAVAPGAAYRISDLELASRLAFFIWSSIPDAELLDLAIRGELGEPAVLDRQVRRMLSDPRSDALVDNFAGQWLYLRNLSGVQPNRRLFPDFNENLRRAFRRETELFFGSILHENRSVVELLTADYTFVNERLARHYGLPNIYGDHIRRVTLGNDARGGLLGQGSLLTVTSYSNRTSPVLRGKWILDNILGTPPPPPPPNVPDLGDAAPHSVALSMRDRMARHRSNPACAVCHARMDPLGLSMENFDAVGRWRTRDESKTAIDASGTMADGTTFDGVVGLRQALVAHDEEFVATLTEKLLTYALGRGLESGDMPAVRAILREAAQDDYRFHALIGAIVDSVPFQMRRAQG